MKKISILLISVFLILASHSAHAITDDGRTTHGAFRRLGDVLGRGLVNLVSLPIEIPRTFIAERENHHWIWPLTGIPRTVLNVVIRATSAVSDIAFYPWIVPFTNDISPWTEPFGLPDYPWQKE